MAHSKVDNTFNGAMDKLLELKSVFREGGRLEAACSEDCDFVCPDCEWELCIVVNDHGRCCDVTILSDGAFVENIANRHLRMPALGVSKRARYIQ